MPHSDVDLYARACATLLASWEEYAHGSSGAALLRLRGVTVAVFPEEPERTFYNNALLAHDLETARRGEAIDAMEGAYAEAGIERYAAWVHETDEGMRGALLDRGYVVEESTRAMGLSLDDIPRARTEADLGESDWFDYLRILGVPAGLLSGADPTAFHVLVARLDGASVATAMAFDHAGDCGVFNVTTLETARRRGLGTALTVRHLHDAAARGCSTASLQSTPMAERVYAAVGFRDLGRILEYAPPRHLSAPPTPDRPGQ